MIGVIEGVIADRIAPADCPRESGVETDPAAGKEEGRRHAPPSQRLQDQRGSARGVAAAVEGERHELAVSRQPVDLTRNGGTGSARNQRECRGCDC